jgi:hypothetical protein
VQPLGLGLAGLTAFAALELHTRKPLLNVSRLGERGVGGGGLMMLAASAVVSGSFLLTSIYGVATGIRPRRPRQRRRPLTHAIRPVPRTALGRRVARLECGS